MFEGFSVAAGQDRFGEHIVLWPNGEPIDCKVSARDTSGAMCVFEFNYPASGPRHLDFDQDEWIYVIEGLFEFHLGKSRKLRLGPGQSVFIPRNAPHVWARVSGERGRIINAYQPAGKMEEFFRELAKYDGKPAFHESVDIDGMHKFFDQYGMDLLGPPLGWEEYLKKQKAQDAG
jgi:quercetin dioxygenase-like cupin family protein